MAYFALWNSTSFDAEVLITGEINVSNGHVHEWASGESGDVKRRRSTKRRGKHKNKRNGEELE
jgi:hypothetical protein